MKDVLTQEEIDELINAIHDGDLDANKKQKNQKIKKHDFRRPNKLSKEQMYSIQSIIDNYVRMISSILSSQLRADIKVVAVSLEQITYGEFIRSVPNPTIMGIFNMEPLQPACILEIKPDIGFYFIDLLFGGSMSKNIKQREFTEIEMEVLFNTLQLIVGNLDAAWQDIVEIKTKMTNLETNPQLNQTLSYGEVVVLSTFKIEINEETNYMNMCIPYAALEGVLDKLVTRRYEVNNASEKSGKYRTMIKKTLGEAKLDVEIVLGNTFITVDEFLELSEGDIIKLNKNMDENLLMYIEKKEQFYVQPGTHKNKMAVQVASEIRRDVEGYE